MPRPDPPLPDPLPGLPTAQEPGHGHGRAALGAVLAMLLCEGPLQGLAPGGPWMLAPLAATLVILCVQPHSPVARPWAVLGSYGCAVLAGLLCGHGLAPVQPLLAGALSVGLCVLLMLRLRCVHPPGAALALVIARGGAQPWAVQAPWLAQLLLNLGLVLLAAWLLSRLVLRRPWPQLPAPASPGLHHTRDAPPLRRIGLLPEDLRAALQAQGEFVDVQEEALVAIYRQAVDHAFGRHIGLTCADIMARDVVHVHADTPLEEAWSALRRHRIAALPVVDAQQRLVGIASVADFLRQIDDTSAAGLAVRLQGLLRRTPGDAGRATLVGQIMTTQVFSATPQTPIAELLPHMTERSLPHIPVLDAARRVVGMVTQSDMLAALHQRLAVGGAAQA